jgi:hypothetical protein
MSKLHLGKTCATASFLQKRRLREAWPDENSRGKRRNHTLVCRRKINGTLAGK